MSKQENNRTKEVLSHVVLLVNVSAEARKFVNFETSQRQRILQLIC